MLGQRTVETSSWWWRKWWDCFLICQGSAGLKSPCSYGCRAETISESNHLFSYSYAILLTSTGGLHVELIGQLGLKINTVSFAYINRIINSPDLESGRNFPHKHNVSNIIMAREQSASAQRRNYVGTRWVYLHSHFLSILMDTYLGTVIFLGFLPHPHPEETLRGRSCRRAKNHWHSVYVRGLLCAVN